MKTNYKRKQIKQNLFKFNKKNKKILQRADDTVFNADF